MKSILLLAYALPPSLSGAGVVEYDVLRDQIYAERPSGALKGNLYLPATGESLSAIVMIHGGGWRSGEAADMERFAERVAEAGFAVFNITYRLAPAHKFPAQLEDVQAAVRWLRANAARHNIDPGRIGAWGYSAGAHLAMLLGTVDDSSSENTDSSAPVARVAAVVAGAGPTDLREYPDNHYVTDLMPGDAGDRLFALASPLASVTADDAPTFLYHGRHDMIVGYHNSTNMHRALQRAGVASELRETSFGHIMTFLFGNSAIKAGIEFLERHLKESADKRAANLLAH